MNRLKGRLVGYEKALVRRREDCTVFRYNHTVAHQRAAFAQQVPYGPLLLKYRGENSLTLRL